MSTSKLKEHMSAQTAHALGQLPTTHENCRIATGMSKDKKAGGIARPGKTARDRARKRGQ